MATWNTDKPAVGNAIADDIPDIEENFQELHDVVEAITNGTLGTTTAADFKVDVVTGYKTKYIPVSDMVPTTTSGAAEGSYEYPTYDVMRKYLAFDGSSLEYACFTITMPEDWDRGTLKAKFKWTPATGCSAGDGVVWGFNAKAVSDDDAIDGVFPTSKKVTDNVTAGTEGDEHVTDATAALTVGSTPALGDSIDFKVFRDPTEGDDDMPEDAWLFGIWIQYQATLKPAAWS